MYAQTETFRIVPGRPADFLPELMAISKASLDQEPERHRIDVVVAPLIVSRDVWTCDQVQT